MKQEAIMATTHLDLQFQRFSRNCLEDSAQLINSGSRPVVNIEHDPTLPPMGKILEAKVEKRDDGEYQLVAIREIFERTFWAEFQDGTRLFKQESETDRRPFMDKYAGLSGDYGITYDFVNFDSREAIELFLEEVRSQSEVEFATNVMGRKSKIPDPEIIVQIANTIATYLVAKKVLERVGDKLVDLALAETAKFYSFVRSAVISATKYMRPEGRPVTYVFVAPGNPTIEFIARSSAPNLVISAMTLEKLEAALSNARYFHQSFGAVRIQYLLNKEGAWEFNYLLTDTGAVIGTEKSYSRRTRFIKLLQEKLDANDANGSN
jgi:hypothetical protein